MIKKLIFVLLLLAQTSYAEDIVLTRNLLRSNNIWQGWQVFNGSVTINGICFGCGSDGESFGGYPNLLITTDNIINCSSCTQMQLNELTVTGDLVVFSK